MTEELEATMTTALMLRDVTAADLDILYEQQNDPEASRLAGFVARERDAFLVHWEKILADSNCVTKAIVYGDRLAGNVASFERDGVREVGYWLGREFRGQGIGSRALATFLSAHHIRPLYARVTQRNRASARVLEKCGFQLVGEDLYHYPPSNEDLIEHIYRLDAENSGAQG